MKNTATIIKVKAAIHSYVAMASPILNPLPDIAMNCSEDIFDAINEVPIAHQVKEPSAKK